MSRCLDQSAGMNFVTKQTTNYTFTDVSRTIRPLLSLSFLPLFLSPPSITLLESIPSEHINSMSINRICVPAVAGPSRMARHAFLRSSAPAINPSLYGRSQFSTAPIRSQSRRQAYTLAHPVDTQSGFEGIPAAGYSGPVDAKSTSGKGKEKAVEPREGHAPPPPPPTSQEAKPRRKIQSKKAAITMVRSDLGR